MEGAVVSLKALISPSTVTALCRDCIIVCRSSISPAAFNSAWTPLKLSLATPEARVPQHDLAQLMWVRKLNKRADAQLARGCLVSKARTCGGFAESTCMPMLANAVRVVSMVSFTVIAACGDSSHATNSPEGITCITSYNGQCCRAAKKRTQLSRCRCQVASDGSTYKKE